MDIVLSHTSALEFWRFGHRGFLAPDTGPACYAKGAELAKRVLSFREQACGFLSEPVHVLLPDPAFRCRSNRVECHVCSRPLPRQSFARIAAGVFVPVPELCFVQMGSLLSMPRLVGLGMEFCGKYSLLPGTDEGFRARSCLTSAQKLSSYCAASEGVRGSERARTASRYVLEGSESPQETVAVELMTFPARWGGDCLPRPCLNYCVTPNAKQRASGMKGHYRCDIFWPEANLAVEYESDRWHTGKESLSRDSVRRAALMQLGIEVVTLTSFQLNRVAEYERVVDLVANRLNVRRRIRKPDWEHAQAKLRAELLPQLSR